MSTRVGLWVASVGVVWSAVACVAQDPDASNRTDSVKPHATARDAAAPPRDGGLLLEDASKTTGPSPEGSAACRQMCTLVNALEAHLACTPGDLIVRGQYVPRRQDAGVVDAAARRGAERSAASDAGVNDSECYLGCAQALASSPQCVPPFAAEAECMSESLFTCVGDGWGGGDDCVTQNLESFDCLNGG